MKFGSLALLILLLVSVVVVGVASGEEGTENGTPTAGEPVSAPVRELPGRRTASSNTFLLSDGSLETHLFEVPVNYRDDSGEWKPIGEELTELPSGAVTNGPNSFDVHLPQDVDQAPVRIDFGGDQWISQQALGVSTEPVALEGEAATYEGSGAGAGYEFTTLPNGLKENIVLSGPSAPSAYHYIVKAASGIGPELLEDGSLVFRDSDGNPVAEMPAPVMSDSAENPHVSSAIHYAIKADGAGSWKLSVETDPQWLSDPDRVWPVTLDPTYEKTVPKPALDCLIVNDGAETRRCAPTETTLVAKANYVSSGTDPIARSLLRFDTTEIPKTAWISSATIGLYSPKTATNITKVDMYDVSRSWGNNNGPTWRFWGIVSKQPWTNLGGDYGKYMPTPTSLTPAERGGSGEGWWNFSSPELTWLAQRWLDGAVANNGVLLKISDEIPHVCCFERRVQWESSAGTKKPYLAVQFIEPASADRKVTSPMDGTKTAKRFLLRSAWEQSGVEGVTYQYKTNQGWKDIPAGQVIDQNNQTVKWPYLVTKPEDRESRPLYWDASGLTGSNPKAKVQIRAVMKGYSGFSTYTKSVTAEVDKNVGGAKDGVAAVGPGSVDLLTGNFTISRTDVSIPAFKGNLEFSRSFSSREPGIQGVLGPGWKPASPLEEAGGSSWTKLVLKEEVEEFEEEGSVTHKWAELVHSEGGVLSFKDDGNPQFVTPDEMSGYVLYRLDSTRIAFTDPEGNRTVFSNNGSGNEYLPISIAMTGGTGNQSRMIYDTFEGKRRLKRVIASAAPGLNCPDETAQSVPGCKLLDFTYGPIGGTGSPTRLLSITYRAANTEGQQSWEVAKYSYDSEGRLTAAWDPRISPELKETYTYSFGAIGTLTPPGQEPWSFDYVSFGTDPGLRLAWAKRATFDAGHPVAQTTVRYGIPLSKEAGGAYDMTGSSVATWGQKDLPTDATAIFPPDEVPTTNPETPPSSYTRAIVYYMDAEGQTVNVATPQGAGTSAPSITTTEIDQFGNIVRELSAQNRLRALAVGVGGPSIAKSEELDTQFRYSKDGTELQEEKGPMHLVRLQSGTTAQARGYRTIQYDTNFKYLNGTETPSPGETKPHLPTSETTGALLTSGSVKDTRTTEYHYNWELRKATETIANPGEAKEEVKSVTAYDKTSGQPTEVRQPSNPEGGGAGTTKTVYYTYKKGGGAGECETEVFAGLPCRIEPAKQPGTAGLPQLPVKKFLSYNQIGEPLEIAESPGGGSENVRKTVATYDAAGRKTTSEITNGGVAVPKTETVYDGSNGMPTIQRFICPGSEPGCDTQATTTTYDTLGRVTDYEDADGVTAEATYDYLGRPATVNDGKGTQTMKYDSVTGLLTEIEDSAAGKFTATYDADGNLVKRGLPNGLTAETTYDETGAAVGLSYTKTTSCGISCNWLNFAVERSVYGQILLENGSLAKNEFEYDKVGRLITARETPSGGGCTTRTYKYDKDSNREEMKTIPGFGSTCLTSGGTEQKYSYDTADRLLGEGLTYDSFGRITNLPGSLAGGKALSTEYFANDMVASQSQNGVTNTFQLDATLRQRQRLQAGGLEGTEVFHYAGPGDSPTWTQRGSIWTRSIVGIGGELVAIQESGKEVELQLTNLHGDVSAVAALSPTATELKATFRFDEFGNLTSGSSPGRFGWLGSQARRTELPSGVIQMGVRSYVPQIGRFLSGDPVQGGSASAYDYANADPVNGSDLLGEKAKLAKAKKVRPRKRLPPASVATVGAALHVVKPTLYNSQAESVIAWLKGVIGSVAPVAWGTCVPSSEVGPDNRIREAFGRGCIPKLKFHVTNVVQASAIKAVGWAWCVVTNAWAQKPTKSVYFWIGATIAYGGFCGAGEREWAYLYFY